jgi:hypothetical protein
MWNAQFRKISGDSPLFSTFISVKLYLFIVEFLNATVLVHTTQKLLIMLLQECLNFVS